MQHAHLSVCSVISTSIWVWHIFSVLINCNTSFLEISHGPVCEWSDPTRGRRPKLGPVFLWLHFSYYVKCSQGQAVERKPSENMSRAAFGVLYNSKELQFVVAQRWWSMCSCGGRVVECEWEENTVGKGLLLDGVEGFCPSPKQKP